MRDHFPKDVKRALADRAGNRCSKPDCGAPTSGPQAHAAKSLNVGVAAHITAASPGGPRYDATLSPEVRSSALNGVWLCQTHAKLVDNDSQGYTSAILRQWKAGREAAASSEIGWPAMTERAPACLPPVFKELVIREATLTTSDETLNWSLWAELYVTLERNVELDIPFHNLSVELVEIESPELFSSDITQNVATAVRLIVPPEYAALPVQRIFATSSELCMRGSARVRLFATQDTTCVNHVVASTPKRLRIKIFPAQADVPNILEACLLPAEDDGEMATDRWVFPAERVKERQPMPLILGPDEDSEWPFSLGSDEDSDWPFANLDPPAKRW